MESLKTYATYLLVLIYIIINLYYKKCINLIIFTVVFIFLYNILNDLNKAIIYSYILSIGYGIFKNFHLLENFDEKKKNNIVFIKDNEDLEQPSEETDTKINNLNNVNSNKINTNNRLKLIRENKKKL